MQSLSVFDEVVKALEQSEHYLRIKTVMWCICNQIWENDPQKLQELDIKNLIPDLRQLNPTLEDLKASLFQVIKTLNKPGEYSLVAKIIFLNVGRLYPEFPHASQSEPSVDERSLSTGELNAATPAPASAAPKQHEQKRAYDPFAVRWQIMNYTNPLRVKILLFSIVEHLFDFSKQDWSNLKSYELDELLQRLYGTCKTVTELENKLQTIAQSLKQREENTQAANAVIQILRPFYTSS